jgi:hypothetical protein
MHAAPYVPRQARLEKLAWRWHFVGGIKARATPAANASTDRHERRPPARTRCYRTITPQAMRAPELPAGSVTSSSGPAWMTRAVPAGWNREFGPAARVTRGAMTLILTRPSGPTTRLGRSPACGPPGLRSPCCLPRRIEVPAGRRKLGRLALADLVDVESMGTRRQFLRLKRNDDRLGLHAQRRPSDDLARCITQLRPSGRWRRLTLGHGGKPKNRSRHEPDPFHAVLLHTRISAIAGVLTSTLCAGSSARWRTPALDGARLCRRATAGGEIVPLSASPIAVGVRRFPSPRNQSRPIPRKPSREPRGAPQWADARLLSGSGDHSS